MKHVILILAATLATSACTPAMYGQHPRYSHYRNRPYEAPPPPPIGRWDNVMMLATGTTVRAARGAAYGAGAVGVLGLIAGRMPPPRLFLAGAIAGAAAGVPPHEMPAGPGTIYLAPHTSAGGTAVK